jgi:hypothetical protein
MSLDVYLNLKGWKGLDSDRTHTGIFVRENGQTAEISREEWDRRYPGREPVTVDGADDGEVYWANITHNLGKMAGEAGIYMPLWRPDEIGVTTARQLIEPLQAGLDALKADPERFEAFNPSNGWGNYDGLVRFVENYLDACRAYPDAAVSVSR